MRRQWLWPAAACVLAGLAWLAGAGTAAALRDATPERVAVRVAATGAEGLLLEIRAPQPTLEVVAVDGVQYTVVEMAGAVRDARGAALPVTGALVAVPPGARVSVDIVEDETMVVQLAAPLLHRVDAGIDLAAALADVARGAMSEYAPATRVAGIPAGLTAAPAPVELVGVERWRSQTVARLRVHPVTMGAEATQLVVHRRLRVAVRIAGGEVVAAVAPVDEGAFEAVLAGAIVNYAQARSWRAQDTSVRPSVAAHGEAWRVRVAAGGMVRLDCAALAAAAFPVAAHGPGEVVVRRDGRSGPVLATEVVDDGDGACEAGEHLLFYVAVRPPRDEGGAVVWVEIGSGAHIEMAAAVAGPVQHTYTHRARYEQNRLYFSYIPLVEGAEHWYWDGLGGAAAERTYVFTTTAPVTGTGSIEVDMAGFDGAHTTRVAVNGVAVGSATWRGRTVRSIAAVVPAGLITEGANRVSITAAGGSGDLQYVDGFTVRYERRLVADGDALAFVGEAGHSVRIEGFDRSDVALYALADPDRPQRVPVQVEGQVEGPCPCAMTAAAGRADAPYLAVTGAGYAAPAAVTHVAASDLAAPAAGADYLIVTPAAYADAVAPLAAQRRAQGLRTRVVDVQEVFDLFGDGRRDADAIGRFLRHTLDAWPAPAPAYVLLVGDGSYDPHAFVSAPPAGIPALLRLVDPVIGETASDNRYVTATAEGQLPQMMIGRLPARTADEVAVMVRKLLRYEAAPAEEAWRARASIVADNAFLADGSADGAGNFWQQGDQAAGLLERGGMAVERHYFNPCTAPACALPDPPYTRYDDAAALTAAIRMSVQAGRHLLLYFGHASQASWAGAPVLLRASDVASFEGAAPFLAFEMTCYTGYFHGPRETVAEALVRAPGGAAASWASSGQSVTRGQDVLLAAALSTLVAPGDPARPVTLGEAILGAKVALYGAGGGAYAEAIDTFHLFGDPALVVHKSDAAVATPAPTAASTPTVAVGVTASVTPAAAATGSATPTATSTATGTATGAATAQPTAQPTAPMQATRTPTPAAAPTEVATPRLFLPAVMAGAQQGSR